MRIDPSGLDQHRVVDLLLARREDAAWTVGSDPAEGR
jgi:hypothetical protein